jgi:hypothetical protein
LEAIGNKILIRVKKLYFVILLLTLPLLVLSQNEKLKVVFIYNFTKYISWPAAQNQGDFIIGVLGSPTMSKELAGYVASRKVGTRSIKVVDFASAGGLQSCHLVYVPGSQNGSLGSVVVKYKTKPVVVVADNPGAIDGGAGLNFILDGGKQKFEFRKTNLEKNGLKVNSELLKMGIEK